MINNIELSQVSFCYGKKEILHKISATLECGKFYGILGPNGCGKTTLLDIIAGFKKPSQGEMLLDSRNIANYNKKELAKKIALVPQEFRLDLGFTVEEVVMMGRHPYIDRFSLPSDLDLEAVDMAISVIGLEEFRHMDANRLSGGQKQRVIVARALAQEAETTLYDEATSNLDISYSLQIFGMAHRSVRRDSKTAVAVLHNLNLAAAYCDEIILMNAGEIVEQGNAKDVLTVNNISKVFNVEARIGDDLFAQSNQVSLCYPKV
ncbi:MAG: ABC transporter ATP-binding protein [Desulfotalea sp.]